MPEPLLTATDVVVDFPTKGFRNPPFRALHGVSVELAARETLGLVGESGSGKSTLGRAILGLAPVTSGTIVFDGRDIAQASRAERRRLGSSIQVIFQDPYSSLNPMMTVGGILAEPLQAQGRRRDAARNRIRDLLDHVKLPGDSVERTPREFSGGQRQRIAIARALALEPRLIICDEPTPALDLSTQATVLELLINIQTEAGVAYLFISHDLAVIRHVSHRVAVMLDGEIVETGDVPRPTRWIDTCSGGGVVRLWCWWAARALERGSPHAGAARPNRRTESPRLLKAGMAMAMPVALVEGFVSAATVHGLDIRLLLDAGCVVTPTPTILGAVIIIAVIIAITAGFGFAAVLGRVAGGYATVITTLPRLRPVSTYRWASANCSSG